MTRFPYHPSRRLAIPAVSLTLNSPDRARVVPTDPAYLDTAADLCVVPLDLIRRLGLAPVGQVGVRGIGEALESLGLYDLVLEIPSQPPVAALVIGHPDEPAVLVGRDVLNHFRVTFDGPNRATEFH